MATGMQRRCDDAAFGIGFILGTTVDSKSEDASRWKQVLILPKLGDDFLFGAGIALVLTELPVGTGIDMAIGPAERPHQLWLSTGNEGGCTDTEIAIRATAQFGRAFRTDDEVLAGLPEPAPVAALEKVEWRILIVCSRTHECLCKRGSRHDVLPGGWIGKDQKSEPIKSTSARQIESLDFFREMC